MAMTNKQRKSYKKVLTQRDEAREEAARLAEIKSEETIKALRVEIESLMAEVVTQRGGKEVEIAAHRVTCETVTSLRAEIESLKNDNVLAEKLANAESFIDAQRTTIAGANARIQDLETENAMIAANLCEVTKERNYLRDEGDLKKLRRRVADAKAENDRLVTQLRDISKVAGAVNRTREHNKKLLADIENMTGLLREAQTALVNGRAVEKVDPTPPPVEDECPEPSVADVGGGLEAALHPYQQDALDKLREDSDGVPLIGVGGIIKAKVTGVATRSPEDPYNDPNYQPPEEALGALGRETAQRDPEGNVL